MLPQTLGADLVSTASGDRWRGIGTTKEAGILAPLFCLYSKESVGLGELEDLKLLIDWAVKSANSVIQLLPMNELGPLFCPYDSVSSFALEPAYLSLRLLAPAKKIIFKKRIGNLKKTFSAGGRYVDYRIKNEKVSLLWDIYLAEKDADNRELEKFISANAYWLWDFAFFKTLKHYYRGLVWWDWEDRFKHRDKNALEAFYQAHEKEIAFQIWLQWLLFKQFKEVKKYAQAKKVLLKGDLPILVSRDSADVWSHPEFFKLEFAAGAPPDMYCAKGQRWGMPTYNWERIASDSYKYLKEKLKYAENFYDILRIDHVVGLFRIWSIPYNQPMENQGLNGFFDPADESKWAEHGRNLLSVIINSTKMLLCAEDLGVIPKACPETLAGLGIPGNDVQRWVKDWKIKHDFLEPKSYRRLSVAMLSTHDTTNWAAWWENEAGTVDEGLFMRKCGDHRQINFGAIKDKLFDASRSRHGRLRWRDDIDSVDKLVAILNQGLSPQEGGAPNHPIGLGASVSKGTVPKEYLLDFIDLYENSYREKEKLWKHLKIKGPLCQKCDQKIIQAALKITLDSNAIFCIQLITDWLYLADIFKGDPYQYRVNTPGTISDKNWSLTIPISLENLLKHKVTKQIRKMIADSKRI